MNTLLYYFFHPRYYKDSDGDYVLVIWGYIHFTLYKHHVLCSLGELE